MFKAVVVGCGAVGSLYDEGRQGLDPYSHAGAYTAHPEIQLIAGADIDSIRRDKFAQMWGVPTYADYSEMLVCERPDIVSICTWPASHAEIVIEAVKAGVQAIFCEKPLADSLPNALQLVEACETHGVPLAVNHLRRWDTAHQQVRDLLAGGKLGDVQHITVHYVRGVANSGSHIADLLRFFCGEVAWVRAFNRLNEPDPDPALDAYIAMQGGMGCALVGCLRGYYDLFSWDIVGTRGRLRIEDIGYHTRLWSVAAHSEFSGTFVFTEVPSPFVPGMHGMMLAAVDNLIHSITDGITPLDTGRDGLSALEIVTALQRSAAAGGERVNLPLEECRDK